MDKRQVKTKHKLADAILSLAATKSVSEITVSEIAQLAEINRSTFYQHATSAADLLQSTLRAELDAIRNQYLVFIDGSAEKAVANVTAAVLDHVERNAEIYRRGLGNESAVGSLHAVLVNHFSESIQILYSQQTLLESVPTNFNQQLAEEMSANYVAYGTVGAYVSWLNSPEPRQKAEFLKIFDALTPAWWPRTSGQ